MSSLQPVIMYLGLLTNLILLSLGSVNGEVFSVTYVPPGNYDDAISRFTPVLHRGLRKDWVARVNFTDSVATDGWSYLEVETKPYVLDSYQAYIAGYMEGAITKDIIYNSWRNTMEGFCNWKGAEYCVRLRAFLKSNSDWMNSMIKLHSSVDPYWYQVSLVLRQLEGLVEGYKSAAKNPINEEDFLWINLSGDLEDLDHVFTGNNLTTAEEWVADPQVTGDGHCSALIKLLPGNVDLYTSHVTWNTLQSMLRIQKKYILPFQSLKDSSSNASVPGYTVAFSSYPAMLHSGDDYYLLSSGLVTMETTIGNSNPALWTNVKPVGEIQEWIRALVANRLATDGHSWCKLFAEHNSGTYNNQWMVVDYKLFQSMHPVRPNTLWVLEQIPGLVVSDDQSHLLRQQGYWASYNVPYYPIIFNTSGIPALVNKYGDWFTYDKTPRALIFKRDHGKVKDLGSMIRLMRYNDYTHDPLSKCNCSPPYSGENAISARSDLNPKNGTYPFAALGHRSHAGTDMKVTSSSLFKHLQFLAVNGPTYDQVPAFQWTTSDFANDTPHYGHPDVWKFPVGKHVWQW